MSYHFVDLDHMVCLVLQLHHWLEEIDMKAKVTVDVLLDGPEDVAIANHQSSDHQPVLLLHAGTNVLLVGLSWR